MNTNLEVVLWISVGLQLVLLVVHFTGRHISSPKPENVEVK